MNDPKRDMGSRGASGYAPENSTEAFEKAVRYHLGALDESNRGLQMKPGMESLV